MTTAIRERQGAAAKGGALKGWTDRELLAACIEGNNRAWQELMRRYDGPLRGTVYKTLAGFDERLPNDYRDDVMGAFYLKLVERDMNALRCFKWEKGKALFKWLAFLVAQCAIDYLRSTLQTPEYEQLDAALEVAEEGGVLASGRPRFRGSLSAHVREEKEREALAEAQRAKVDRRRKRRAASKRK